jgi:type I restriction enzyme S subunit
MTAVGRVADLAEQIRGVTYGKEDASSNPRPGYLPVLRAGNIADDRLVFDDLVFVPAERIAPAQKIRRNDVVIAASSGSLDVVGKAARALADFEGGFGAFCKVLRPGPGIDPAYFAHFFRTREYRHRVSALAAGANINNLRNEHLDDFKIPLLPLPEQQRIAKILDKADALRAMRRAARAQLDTLTQSTFLDMFGDPATNPKGWPVVSIADICEVKGGKRLPKGEEYSSVPTAFRYIRVIDLKGGCVDESALVYLKPEIQAEIARYVVSAGDVIISIAGSIGLVAAVPQSLDGVNLTENAAKLVQRQPGQYEAEYLARFLESDHAQAQIGSHVGQVTIGKLALFRIEKIKVPLPPIEVQREFVRRVVAIGARAAAQRAAASRSDELFASLQYYAFRGEL